MKRKRDSGSRCTDWQSLHDESIVWLLHDHFFHRLDANLAMREGGVTAKVVLPIGDLAIYNDSDGEGDLAFYERTLAQTDGWAVESLVRHERARRLFESRPDRFILAEKAQDALRAKREGKSAIFFGMEGSKALEGRIEMLGVFYRLGVRQMQLIWATPNQLVSVENGAWRLSPFGKEVLAGMNELGIVADLAHVPQGFFEDVARHSKAPFIVSHNVPDDLSPWHLDALKACKGIVGLHFCRHCINGPDATLDDFLDTVDRLVDAGYEDVVAIGGDLFEVDSYFYARHPAPAGAVGKKWSAFIDELSDIRLVPNITRGLCERGYSDGLIKKILGGNALRLYQTVLGG